MTEAAPAPAAAAKKAASATTTASTTADTAAPAATPETKTETEKAPEAKAVAPAPPPPPAATPAPPAGPKESPRQLAASTLRGELGPIVEVLVRGDGRAESALKRMGAALMAAHFGTELPKLAETHAGDPDAKADREAATKWAFGAAAAALTPADVLKLAAQFRSKYPGAWGAANRCDVSNFVRFLKVAKLRGFPGDLPLEQMIVTYQGTMSKLGAS